MAGRSYPRLGIEAFGRELITSGDLDPVYVALHGLELPDQQLARWLVAYWCTYHCGFASYASEHQDSCTPGFWELLARAAANSDRHPAPGNLGRWPRAAERRHWRGATAVKSVEDLHRRYRAALGMVQYVSGTASLASDPVSYEAVKKRVLEHYAFGDWIAFKIGDMLERVCGVPVDFGAAPLMYDDPRKAMLMVWRQKQGLPETARPKNDEALLAVESAVSGHLLKEFADLTAPPLHDRRIGPQEVETVLCKWKSHVNGHYPVHNDLNEIRRGVEPWAVHSSTAKAFLHYLPRSTNVYR